MVQNQYPQLQFTKQETKKFIFIIYSPLSVLQINHTFKFWSKPEMTTIKWLVIIHDPWIEWNASKKSLNIAFFSQVCASPHWAICSQFESIWQSSSVVSNEYGACLNSTHVLTQGITFNIFLFLLFTSSTLHCHKFRLVVGLGESSGLMEKGHAESFLDVFFLWGRGHSFTKLAYPFVEGGPPGCSVGAYFLCCFVGGGSFSNQVDEFCPI